MGRGPRKVGRNDPCPCGSGRKYKRCCLDKAGASGASEGTKPGALRSGGTQARRGLGLTAYTVAKIAENPGSAGGDSRLRRSIERGLQRNWTIRKVGALGIERLEAQLRDYGVQHSRPRFLQIAEGTDSAWEVSHVWIEQDPVTCVGKEVDFLGLAACELWKRLLPGRPSMEMLDDWMQDGYRLLEEGQRTEACDVWARVWTTLRPRFAPAMTTMEAASETFEGMQCLFNWCQDFKDELEHVARERVRYASLGNQYCLEWAAQFGDERDSIQVSFHRSLAAFLLRLGRRAEGAAVLYSLSVRWPRDVWGYVAAADAHSHLFQWADNLELDLEPRRFLERGLEVEGLEDQAVLKERLAALEERHR